MHHGDGAGTLEVLRIVIGLLGAALVVGVVSEFLVVPDAVALLIGGLIVGAVWPQGHGISFGPALLLIFLPPLLFEAAYALHVDQLRSMWRPIVTLAVPGVVFSAGCIALGTWATGAVTLAAGLLLGAMIAATDPVAVVAVFRRMNVPLELTTILEAESIVNDGTSLVLFNVALPLALALPGVNLGGIAWHALLATFGGMGIGFATAFIVALPLTGVRGGALQVLATVFVAYASYLAAEQFAFSGIFATAVSAVTLRVLRSFPTSDAAAEEIDRFWSVVAFVTNGLVFLLMGVNLQIRNLFDEPLVIGVALTVLIAARVVLAYGIIPLVGIPGGLPWRHVIAISGIRGGLSLALALSLPENTPGRSTLLNVVFAVVLVTLVGQSLAMRPIIARLRLSPEEERQASGTLGQE